MDATESEVVQDFFPFVRVYKNGQIERFLGTEIVSPSLDDPKTGVQSKDVVYSTEANLSSRLYLPKDTSTNQKLPLLVYFHGGGFVVETAFSPLYQNYLNSLVAEARVMAVSVDYRRAPEHELPVAHDDCWTALKWVASHFDRNGPEEWLNSHADFGRVFCAGDSAGANIAHNMAMRCGQEKIPGIDLKGIVLIHPYFWGKDPVGDEESEGRDKHERFWRFVCPATSGCDDPLINPVADPNFASLGCPKVLVIVAGKDFLKHRGRYYYENLKKCGWSGEVEIMEAEGEGHVFHMFNPAGQNSVAMLQKISALLNN
uniref:Uncharacterized protein MANES_10G066400 n=1 Tax=Rhizophora mucronata TaxID=61149 RepID=A0A2P2IN98_RHIMU